MMITHKCTIDYICEKLNLHTRDLESLDLREVDFGSGGSKDGLKKLAEALKYNGILKQITFLPDSHHCQPYYDDITAFIERNKQYEYREFLHQYDDTVFDVNPDAKLMFYLRKLFKANMDARFKLSVLLSKPRVYIYDTMYSYNTMFSCIFTQGSSVSYRYFFENFTSLITRDTINLVLYLIKCYPHHLARVSILAKLRENGASDKGILELLNTIINRNHKVILRLFNNYGNFVYFLAECENTKENVAIINKIHENIREYYENHIHEDKRLRFKRNTLRFDPFRGSLGNSEVLIDSATMLAKQQTQKISYFDSSKHSKQITQLCADIFSFSKGKSKSDDSQSDIIITIASKIQDYLEQTAENVGALKGDDLSVRSEFVAMYLYMLNYMKSLNHENKQFEIFIDSFTNKYLNLLDGTLTGFLKRPEFQYWIELYLTEKFNVISTSSVNVPMSQEGLDELYRLVTLMKESKINLDTTSYKSIYEQFYNHYEKIAANHDSQKDLMKIVRVLTAGPELFKENHDNVIYIIKSYLLKFYEKNMGLIDSIGKNILSITPGFEDKLTTAYTIPQLIKLLDEKANGQAELIELNEWLKELNSQIQSPIAQNVKTITTNNSKVNKEDKIKTLTKENDFPMENESWLQRLLEKYNLMTAKDLATETGLQFNDAWICPITQNLIVNAGIVKTKEDTYFYEKSVFERCMTQGDNSLDPFKREIIHLEDCPVESHAIKCFLIQAEGAFLQRNQSRTPSEIIPSAPPLDNDIPLSEPSEQKTHLYPKLKVTSEENPKPEIQKEMHGANPNNFLRTTTLSTTEFNAQMNQAPDVKELPPLTHLPKEESPEEERQKPEEPKSKLERQMIRN